MIPFTNIYRIIMGENKYENGGNRKENEITQDKIILKGTC